MIASIVFMAIATCAHAAINTNTVIDKVNGLRSLHNAQPVKWSQQLASVSFDWANHMAQSNKFAHSDTDMGENLAAFYGNNTGSDGTPFVLRAVESWYNESLVYNFNKPGYQNDTGHFTQLVWNASNAIGAAVGRAMDGTIYVVMNFMPAGNVGGIFGTNVFATSDIPIVIANAASKHKKLSSPSSKMSHAELLKRVNIQRMNMIVDNVSNDPDMNCAYDDNKRLPPLTENDEPLSMIMWDMTRLPGRCLNIRKTNWEFLDRNTAKMFASYRVERVKGWDATNFLDSPLITL
eukprot:gene19549-26231_t